MAEAIQPCPLKPDPCKDLADKIAELVNRVRDDGSGTKGLKQRFQEQIEGANGPPGSGVGDPAVWQRHEDEIEKQQKAVRDRLDEYNKNNCGDKVPVISDAWEWATKPAPSGKQWKGPQVAPATSSAFSASKLIDSVKAATGLTGVALGIYLVISEGSRLFPPRNLVPVP